MAIYSSIFAWEIPWRVESGGLTVDGVAKSQTWLSDWAHTCAGLRLSIPDCSACRPNALLSRKEVFTVKCSGCSKKLSVCWVPRGRPRLAESATASGVFKRSFRERVPLLLVEPDFFCQTCPACVFVFIPHSQGLNYSRPNASSICSWMPSLTYYRQN